MMFTCLIKFGMNQVQVGRWVACATRGRNKLVRAWNINLKVATFGLDAFACVIWAELVDSHHVLDLLKIPSAAGGNGEILQGGRDTGIPRVLGHQLGGGRSQGCGVSLWFAWRANLAQRPSTMKWLSSCRGNPSPQQKQQSGA